MPKITPEEAARRGRLGAATTHSRYDSRELTREARIAFEKRFENDVDPERILTPAERARRASHAKKAYFARLALKSAQARSKGAKSA